MLTVLTEESRSPRGDLWDDSVGLGTIHNRVMTAVEKARNIHQNQDLSSTKVPLLEELFHTHQPVWTGVV